MRIGYKLLAEGYSPQEMVRQAVRAEEVGFDFVEASDHYHPWLEEQGHSGFVWSILAAIAANTERIRLAPGVTCPFIRYHPAIVAQAAATTALLSNDRFFLGLGAGERLNEHVVGQGWPAVRQRHAMLRESLQIIRLLWKGGYQSFDGRYLTLEDAQVFDLPKTPPHIVVAGSGPSSARIAAELGDALFGTTPDPDLVRAYADAGGTGAKYGEVPLSWAPDDDTALASARAMFRFALTGWKVQSELPNPVHFAAATELIDKGDMSKTFGYGPDAERHLAVARQFAEAGFDRLVLVNVGPDPDGFFDFFAAELAEPLRALTPGS
ncbi:MAG: TIGR03557 family F420-dependent LLM class oxidoreductase [Nocardiopsaceae bacterium]|nr:TIGR03557 family F420-dependent LLM class oxidoreductase [Nocardiopsaceae bacterium]